jgi:hypothetical protein
LVGLKSMSLLQLASHANSEELHFELEFRILRNKSLLKNNNIKKILNFTKIVYFKKNLQQ